MSLLEWTARAPWEKGVPTDARGRMVEYRAEGGSKTLYAMADGLNWGDRGGWAVAKYRVLPETPLSRRHAHYFKPVSGLAHVDVYRVLALFDVTDQALGHAIKKLLVAGGRGAGKDIRQDVQEAVDALLRWQEMRDEDARA